MGNPCPAVIVIVTALVESEDEAIAFEVDVITSEIGGTAETVYVPDPLASG
jgi:hypothetical protein